MSPKKTTLMAVTGMSPAILTETVWALANPKDGSRAIIPEQVVAITTSRGAESLQTQLLTPATAWYGLSVWECLRKEILSSPTGCKHDPESALQLCAPRVIEMPDRQRGVKRAADDLRSAEDNEITADFVLEEVRRVVENPDTTLIASIAGGRKTMGVLLYAAMSLLGRDQDRVTHVLVNEPYDQCSGFFYPQQPAQHLTARSGLPGILAKDARIELADIPFVALRNLFEKQLARKPGGFRGLVTECSNRVEQSARTRTQLVINESKTGMQVNGITVDLSPPQHLLMLFLARRVTSGQPPINKYLAAIQPLRAFAGELHTKAPKADWSDWRHESNLPDDFDDQRLRKLLDEIRKKLKQGGSDTAALLPLLPIRGRFSLAIDKDCIRVLAESRKPRRS